MLDKIDCEYRYLKRYSHCGAGDYSDYMKAYYLNTVAGDDNCLYAVLINRTTGQLTDALLENVRFPQFAVQRDDAPRRLA